MATPNGPESPAGPTAKPAMEGRFPVVGLGASAGGLGALEEFLTNLPPDTGMAFVVVTHQHPDRSSMLRELLGRKTAMPVVQVDEPTNVEPDHVYTVSPGYDLAILGGRLQPIAAPRRVLHMPIDFFFRSLAHDKKEVAVGIVLSGTGSDGSLGLTEIKAELGMVMVQDEASAEYTGMPHSAIATELVDYVLPASQMPARLVAYAAALRSGGPDGADAEPDAPSLQPIFVLIRDRTGHDFSHYKASTVGRRVERRRTLHHIDTAKRYVQYLRAHPAEVDLLFKELLIGVTSFFRDPAAWEALRAALHTYLADKPRDYLFRAWIPGCATGEEAYSVAMLLREIFDGLERPPNVQLFATDIDEAAIEVARAGAYPLGIVSDVSTPRLARFFSQEGGVYRIKKELREMVVFATQNLAGDPPFTKLDLLSCRNLLIYLDAELQHHLIPIFHYALRPAGILFLGSSESVGPEVDLFETVDKKAKVFCRREVAGKTRVDFPASALRAIPAERVLAAAGAARRQVNVVDAAQRVLLTEMVPPTVFVHERGDVVVVHGRTGMFLEPAQGAQARPNIFNMAREGLQISLSRCLREAAASSDEVVVRGVEVRTNGTRVAFDLRAQRLARPEALRGVIRLSFENTRPVPPDATETALVVDPGASERMVDLERELLSSKESHQDTIEQLETANEELQSANEELQSTNEELQSANEELETSKEEMQSLNEELQTVNAELQAKLEDISRANNDMKNLLNGTEIATVFVDHELRIKRFTERAKQVIRLIESDIGRPIGDLASTLRYDRLIEDAQDVLRTLVVKETEVRSDSGETYLTRILPYRTTDNVIEGLVFTFVDITKLKAVQAEQDRLVDVLQRSPVGVFGQDRDLRITWTADAVFGRPSDTLLGKTDADLLEPADAEALTAVKRGVLEQGVPARQRTTLAVDGRHHTYDLYLEPQRDDAGRVVGLSCVAVDLTTEEVTA